MNTTMYRVLLAITSILCLCFTILLINPKRPTEYRFDTINEEIGIRDFLILDTGKYIYIPDTFYIENYSGNMIEKILLSVKSKNKDLFTLSTGVVLDDKKYYPNLGSIRKFNLTGSKKITVEVEYWFEGSKKSKLFSEEIQLIDAKK